MKNNTETKPETAAQQDTGGDSPSATCSSVGEAFAEACDPKLMRTKVVPSLVTCRICHHKLPAVSGHSVGCQLATMEDARQEVDRARRHEKWARERAEFWLLSVRQMHGKLAMLKAEVKKLRSRTNVERDNSE